MGHVRLGLELSIAKIKMFYAVQKPEAIWNCCPDAVQALLIEQLIN